MITTPRASARRNLAAALIAAGIFAAFSALCAVYSKGFLEQDAMTHFLFARCALREHHYLLNVWGRPLVTALYALPAQYGILGARLLSLALALLCGAVTYRLAREQGMTNPALAAICLFAQPLFFLHSFSELTELPFATLLVLAFWVYQRRQFAVMTGLAALLPLARPEGFGFVLLAAAALVFHRRKRWLVMLILPLVAWSYLGWVVAGRPPMPWWTWLIHSWPYSAISRYGHGSPFWFVGILPMILSPLIFPALGFGIWRMWKEGIHAAGQHSHLGICKLLVVCIPLAVLAGHSFLWWRGLEASNGEPRYLLVAAPMWALLCAAGWEWFFARFALPSPLLWAGLAALLPAEFNRVYRVLPLPQYDQDLLGQNVAEWYCRNTYVHDHYPRVMASLPSVCLYLEMSKSTPTPGVSWGKANVAADPDGTLLLWDPIEGTHNSDQGLCVPLEAIQNPANGWVFCRRMAWGDKYCLIYLSRRDAQGQPTGKPPR